MISDLEVITLNITVETFGLDSKILLFHRPYYECKEQFPKLIIRKQFSASRNLTARYANDRYANDIRKDVALAIDDSDDVSYIDSKLVKYAKTHGESLHNGA